MTARWVESMISQQGQSNQRTVGISAPASAPLETEADVIRSNIRRIDQVLNYWFSQGPAISQKQLWMITSQRGEWRKQVDADIVHRFGELIAHPPKAWWTDSELYGCRGKVAAVVVLDQFSRHAQRFCDEQGDGTLTIPPQSQLDKLAYQVAETAIEDLTTQTNLPIAMLIFLLLPLRHRSSIDSLQWTQQQTEVLASLHCQYDDMIRSFRKATNRRLAVLQDDNRRTAPSDERTDFSDDSILECSSFKADLSSAPQHIVYQTIFAFLDQKSISDDLVVSLSGGVDSMVILSVLSLIRPSKVIAVHIDYANRPESAAEADFLRRHCQDLAVPFHCRRIEEVTRGVTARDEYEKLSRTIRYQAYHSYSRSSGPPRVLLGHHRGDLRENVLSNAHKGSGPLDLSGMTSVSWNDGVQLLRPLLPLEKVAIYDYAHTYGIPYFKDTTPHWSTRGKLRRKLLPLVQEVYGDGCLNNLSQLAVESDSLRELFSTTIVNPFLQGLVKDRMGICFQTRPWKHFGVSFWKFVLKEALHSVGLGMWSDKSVITFYQRVCELTSTRSGWLQCRKDQGVYFDCAGRVFVFYPDSFPWPKSAAYKLPSSPVGVGETVSVGPWSVSYTMHGPVSEDFQHLLNTKAVTSMDDFLKGIVTYYMKSPIRIFEDGSLQVQPLVFGCFSKEDRPMAWKNVDKKVEERLPLLRNGRDVTYTTGENRGPLLGVVKVVLERSSASFRPVRDMGKH